jgi:hypothetical protein
MFGLPESEFIFYTAKDYFEQGFEILKTAHPIEFRFGEKTTWKLCVPITLLSFSLEIVLKSFIPIIPKNLTPKQKHDLYILYNLIEPSMQADIESHFETCDRYNKPFFNIVLASKDAPRKQRKEGFTAREKITYSLERCNDSFTKFRYLYEWESPSLYEFDFNTMLRLAHACLAVKAKELNISY